MSGFRLRSAGAGDLEAVSRLLAAASLPGLDGPGSRDSAPAGLAASSEGRPVCPASSVAMRLAL